MPPTNDTAPKDSPFDKCLWDHSCFANMGWDNIAQTLQLPSFTENGECIYCNSD